jgi:predicted nucleotidyltransferase
METNNILTKKELEVINKKLSNQKLTQQDSNRLSRFVRPKLKKIREIDSEYLLKRLNYNPKSRIFEKKIRNYILKNLEEVKSIIIYGSAIISGYTEYNDIDVLVVTERRLWKNNWERDEISKKLEEKAEKLNLDIQLIDEESIKKSYSSNISLIYQLKDSKTIYGKINLPKKIEIPKINIRMKMDWSNLDENPSGEEIYNGIRNTLLIKLLLNKIISNNSLSKSLINELGKNLVNNLKKNTASKEEEKIALKYLNEINRNTLKQIMEAKWEKIVI